MGIAAREMKIKKLYEFGQSIWLDNIGRSIIDNGQLGKLIDSGVSGVTSNPSIFDKAISESCDYEDYIRKYKDNGLSAFEIYDELTVKDIQDAADLFLPVFRQTESNDGYVSLEVNPLLAHNVEETIKEAQRLHRKVNRINVMFKIPATDEGLEAGLRLLSQGININFTLIFSLGQYAKVADTFIRAAKELSRNGRRLDNVHSVASVFVSRIDSSVDKLIDEKSISLGAEGKCDIQKLKGRAAVANSGFIFAKYFQVFSGKEFREMSRKGLKKQRVLWASTSTKNPAYSDIKYVTELIGKDTINTMPQSTIEAFLDHGIIKNALVKDSREAGKMSRDLNDFGIDVDKVCEVLLKDGVIAFEKSFSSLLKAIELKGEAVKI